MQHSVNRKDKAVEISTRRFKQLALICGLGAAGILAGCGSNSTANGGTGGSSATGGSTGRGGASATGGANSTGGSNATGGATSLGGSSAGPVTLFDFASGDENWTFNTYQATDSSGAVTTPYNLVVPGNLSGGDLDAGVAAPTIAADSTVGDPAGSLKVVVTFTGNNQQVNPNADWAAGSYQDWTNKTVSVDIKVDPAVPATFTGGGIQLFAQDSTWAGWYQWADFPTDNAWHTYTLNMAGTTLDPTQITQFTVQFSSANTPAPADGGVASVFTPVTVTAYIDNITVQPSP
jgi:hypothetical protein